MREGQFTKEETQKLRELYESGVSIADICKTLDRKEKSILNKIYHMELRRK